MASATEAAHRTLPVATEPDVFRLLAKGTKRYDLAVTCYAKPSEFYLSWC